MKSIEVCAGAGGQALGMERAGFEHLAAVEIDSHASATLRINRPEWNVVEEDLHSWDPSPYVGEVDLFAGGVPCPPFSMAGKQLGEEDERDLFPRALDLIEVLGPSAVLLENVRGLSGARFANYRKQILDRLYSMGYTADWKLLNASDFGVPQLRPRFILVALKHEFWDAFRWPSAQTRPAPSVGEALKDLMGANGWEGAELWARRADRVAPTLVGGSKKHGGADLGPTRAKRAWAELGVDGKSLANEAPQAGFEGMPKLTLRMAARIQGFPDSWQFAGRKTASYRQIGNAFPPQVAEAVGLSIRQALQTASEQTAGLLEVEASEQIMAVANA